MAVPLLRAQLAGYQRGERIANAQLEALEEQPEPGTGLHTVAGTKMRS